MSGTRFAGYLETIRKNVVDIENIEVKNKIEKQSDALIIDIRTEPEWKQGHLPKAVFCDRGYLEINIEKIAPHPEQEIILYCGGGTRSSLSAESLWRMGYQNVKSMVGGFRGWQQANFPIDQ